MFIPIEKSIEIIGSLTAMANALNVKPPTVHQWKTGEKPVPVRFCKTIETLTSNKVTCIDLRPHDWCEYWPELKDVA